MKDVYLLFTRSGTMLSRVIRFVTGEEFTHVAISTAASPVDCLEGFYSFTRKYACLPLPAGFIREYTGGGYLGRHPMMKCGLFRLSVSDEAYRRIDGRLRLMGKTPGVWQYNLLGLLCCAFGMELRRRRHFFCSQFVGELLTGAVPLPKPAGLMHPVDYLTLPGLSPVYIGTVLGMAEFLYCGRDRRRMDRAAVGAMPLPGDCGWYAEDYTVTWGAPVCRGELTGAFHTGAD